MKPQIWYHVEMRENFTGEKWVKVLLPYREDQLETAIKYRDGANANHPGAWRLVKVVEEWKEIETVTVEGDYVETSREVVP